MRVLIDIGHPAHVHLFKNFAKQMMAKGNKVLFTCRDKEFEINLLKSNGLDYISFGKKYKSVVGKIWGMFKFDLMEWKTALKFKPDVFLSHGSIYAAHASFLCRKPHISFEDTFNFEQIRLYEPFTDVILTSDYDHPLISKKVIKYVGYHELAYLHPNNYIPDKSILKLLGVNENEKYVIIRFVAWAATHDIGHKGISYENKLKAIDEFSKYARVFISSESELPEDLKKYKINIPPERMHDALAYASLVFGESATMVTEGCCLGVSGIYLDNTGRLYTKDIEKNYELCYNFTESLLDQKKAISIAIELLKNKNIKLESKQKKEKLISDKIDLTTFLVWFVENYPESAKIMKETPDYQFKFK